MSRPCFIILLFILVFPGMYVSAQEKGPDFPVLIPEIVSLGYGTYLSVVDMQGIVQGDWFLESGMGTSLLLFDALYITGNTLSIVSKINQNKNLEIASRFLMAGSVAAPLIWSLFSAAAEGEDRLQIFLTRLIPGGLSFGFTFIR